MNRRPIPGILLALALTPSSAWAAPPAVALPQEPLFGAHANVHPNLLLSLSVEFPTVGIAYRGQEGYDRTREYLGYFNPRKCYVYEGGNRNFTARAWFRIHADAEPQTHECDGRSFSGNFMNWVSTSAIDVLRYALTGGDRVIDERGLTVLQRAVLHESPAVNFYAHPTYFPRRALRGGGNSSAPGRVTPFDVDTLYIVSCRNRILFSDETSAVEGGSPAAAAYCTEGDNQNNLPDAALDRKLGEYLVRVRVCDAHEGPYRTDLCMRFGDDYKPVGVLQRNADRLRVGVMSYLQDDAATRYGGVLRAPLKYLGHTRFQPPRFLREANNSAEWDADTGILREDPDQVGGGTISGAINYLNRFGRNGRYKGFDPVGELYYEGLRYLQGAAPTPEATVGMTGEMRDGFPVHEDWQDPVTASCQRNHILAIADVNTHWDRYIPGNERTTFGNNYDAYDRARPADAGGMAAALDVKHWTRLVGEMETDVDGHYANPSPNPALNNLHTKDTGSGGHGTYYMAGLAYWANTQDIRHDKPIRVRTYTIDVDEDGNGTLDGNTRALRPRDSQLYLAAKYGGFIDRNNDGNPFVTLDTDGITTRRGSNDEWSDGDNRPTNYFLASQPQQMIAAIRQVFDQVTGSSGTISGVGLAGMAVGEHGTYVYQPAFEPARWSGSLRKISVRRTTDGNVALAPTYEWDAAEILTGTTVRAPVPGPGNRRIFTLSKRDDRWETIEFSWDQLNRAQREALDRAPLSGLQDGLGELRLAYLRGVREREVGVSGNGVFRRRDRILGDIVNSNPLYVGAPPQRSLGDGYAAFANRQKDRRPVVYVGANDGMLHAFDADNGEELFAYVPNVMIDALPSLTVPEYRRRPFVDGGLGAGEARINGSWRSVLAGGFGGGAQGVFALDITNPTDFRNGLGVLFEFTDAVDPDIGHIMAPPAIARFRVVSRNGSPAHRDFMVVTSGLNNYAPDGSGRHNNDGAGALFLIALDKPAGQAWEEGRNYYKFRTPVSDSRLPSGAAAPALVVGADGIVRRAYFGDLQGNLWRFDFSEPLSGRTRPAPALLFTARDGSGIRQPITVQPRVVFAPAGGYLVLFGTGKYLEADDTLPENFRGQSFYAIHDTGQPVARVDLVPRVLLARGDGLTVSGDPIRYDGERHKGWYLDFQRANETGERLVRRAEVFDEMVFFNTLMPGADPCSSGGGRSYVLNTLTGFPSGGGDGATGTVSRVGMVGSPVVLQTSVEVGNRNAIGERVARRGHTVVNFGTGGASGTAAPLERSTGVSQLRAGRYSWREILNWQELRNAWSRD